MRAMFIHGAEFFLFKPAWPDVARTVAGPP
jgi:hypothetical protein